MNLSSELISQFVKVTKDEKPVDNGSTVYGTIVEYEGNLCVKLDGSDQITPITTTTKVGPGDRVAVLIKNHSATVTGNVTSPSAKSEDVDKLDEKVIEIGDKISEFDIVIADMVSTGVLNATVANIEELIADKASIGELNAAKAEVGELIAKKADIEDLNTTNATIDNLKATMLTAEAADIKYATIENLDATNLKVNNLSAAFGEFEDLTTENFKAVNAEIDDLDAKKLSAEAADIKYATIDNLNATNATIDNLDAKYATIDNLDATNATIKNLDTKYATIENLNATNAEIDNLDTKYATIESLNATNANVTNLSADVADIDTLIFGSATGTTIQTSFANAVVAQLGNAQIKSAMIDTVSADKINAGDINTNIVRIVSEDGKMLLADETIQISDATRVRVQIGKDASGDYSINIWDADGKLMFSEGGITDDAIKEAIIRNDMVSENANISASKLDISSLFTEINGSTETIKSNRIYLDEQKQTLDVSFTQMSTDLSDLSDDVSSQGTQLSVVQGQITSKVWQQDIDTAKDEIDGEIATLSTKQSTLEQTVNGISSTVSQHTSQISNKADSSTVTAVSDKVGTLEQTVDGLSSTVSQHTTQISNKADSSTVTTINNKVGTLENTVDGLSSTVSDHTTQISNKADSSTVTTISNKVGTLENTVDGLSNTVSQHTSQIENKADGSIVTAVSDKVNTLENTVDGLSSTVSQHTTQISSKADGSTVTAVSNKVNTLETTVNGLSNTVSQHTTQIASKADGSAVTEVNDRVTSLSSNLDGFKSTVSSTYATKTALASTDGNVSSLTTRVSNAETAIDQNEDAIALRATKTELNAVSSDLANNYYTKSQTDSQIKIASDSITSTVEATYQKTVSKGEQLVTNGNALLGDDTNFSGWTFDGAVTNNSPGSFTMAQGVKKTAITDEYFPVNTNNEYTFSFDMKSLNGLACAYSMLLLYDADKQEVKSPYHIYLSGSTTTLAQDLKAGDTVIHLTDSSGWSTSFAYGFYLIIWNYTNSFGYTYPAETYSRNRITLPKTSANKLDSACLNKTAHTITLTTAYSGATIPAGTSVSQGGDGATYKYCPLSNVLIPTEWTSYSGKMSGVDYSGENISTMFPPGTAYAKVGFLWNYNSAADQLWVTNISVTETTAISAAQEAADAALSDIDELVDTLNTNYTTKSEFKQTTSNITGTVSTLKEAYDERVKYVDEELASLKLSSSNLTLDITSIKNDGVTKVSTSTGYTFDSTGLTIDKTDAQTKTQITEDGMTVYQKNGTTVDAVLTATSDGVNAKNLHATTYLIVGGRSRFENFGTDRTGCFWIGG